MTPKLRIGYGTARRSLLKGQSFRLCGSLRIEGWNWEREKFSDPILASVSDALLGAAGLGGFHSFKNNYPDSDYPGLLILKNIEQDLHYNGFEIINID